MTDRERLESLKRNKEWTEATGGKFHTVDKEDYEWLIKQAERVSKQETRINNLTFDLAASRAQNNRYREAIKVAVHNMKSSDNLGVKFALGILERALEGEE